MSGFLRACVEWAGSGQEWVQKVRPKAWKQPCCILLQAIRHYTSLLQDFLLWKKDINKFASEQWRKEVCVSVCVFLSVLQVRLNAACVPAKTFHSLCIILSVGSSDLLLSHLVWDECARARIPECVSVCLGAPPPLFPESSTQLNSGCVLRPHIMPNFCKGASQSIWSVFVGEKGGRLFQKYTQPPAPRYMPPPSVLSELPSNKRRSQSRKCSQPNLSCEALSRQLRHILNCYPEGLFSGGTADDQQEAG